MRQIILISVYFFVISGGCVSSKYKPAEDSEYKPTEEEIAKADYGKYPDDYEGIIKTHFQTILKDPESARYRFPDKPQKTHRSGVSLKTTEFCWIVKFYLNAKNSFGGYTGEKFYMVWIRDGKVIGHFG